LPRAADVQLDIHAVNGALVRSLVQGYRAEGAGKAVWDGRDERGRTVGSGVYFAVLHAGNTHLVQKVTLLK
jgi:flagellar hook assembly protein FlgD